MHPTTLLLLARSRTEESEREIARGRLAHAAAQRPHGSGASAPAWRRWLGWALIGAGVRLAGGGIPVGSRSAHASLPGR